LYGIHAISAQNGWAMAVAGALIVFAGLVVLSTVISQLHKILTFFEQRYESFRNHHTITEDVESEDEPELPLPKEFPTDLNEIARLYEPLIEQIGDTFYLSDLYEVAREKQFPHPHITLTAFREEKFIIPYGDGVFSWNPPTENEDNENA